MFLDRQYNPSRILQSVQDTDALFSKAVSLMRQKDSGKRRAESE
jgi:hypothetical protein